MARTSDENLLRLLRLTREMMALADEGDRNRIDPSCGAIYGLVRDSAYKLARLARLERQRHEPADDLQDQSGEAAGQGG